MDNSSVRCEARHRIVSNESQGFTNKLRFYVLALGLICSDKAATFGNEKCRVNSASQQKKKPRINIADQNLHFTDSDFTQTVKLDLGIMEFVDLCVDPDKWKLRRQLRLNWIFFHCLCISTSSPPVERR